MNPEVLPQRPLNLLADLVRLAPPETSTKAHITATLDYLEAKQEAWVLEQNRRLVKAEKRIKLCAFLHGMLSTFGLRDFHPHRKHFSWCPFEDWMGNELQGLDELFDTQN